MNQFTPMSTPRSEFVARLKDHAEDTLGSIWPRIDRHLEALGRHPEDTDAMMADLYSLFMVDFSSIENALLKVEKRLERAVLHQRVAALEKSLQEAQDELAKATKL